MLDATTRETPPSITEMMAAVPPRKMMRASALSRDARLEGVRRIIRDVANEFGIDPVRLIGHSRRAALVDIRHWAMWLAHTTTGASSGEIGRCFGGRDHTSVLYAIEKFENDGETLRARAYARKCRAILGRKAAPKQRPLRASAGS